MTRKDSIKESGAFRTIRSPIPSPKGGKVRSLGQGERKALHEEFKRRNTPWAARNEAFRVAEEEGLEKALLYVENRWKQLFLRRLGGRDEQSGMG